MKFLLIAILLTLSFQPSETQAWESGNAPFCLQDNIGNLQCYYYSQMACRSALNIATPGSNCIRNPNQ